MNETAAAPLSVTGRPRHRFAGAVKLFAAAAFLFVTGGPSVIAQYDDSAASYWQQERLRMQARKKSAPAQRPGSRAVEQRPTRMIRGAAPKKGFTRVVPQLAHPAPHQPGPVQRADTPNAAQPAVPATVPAPAQPGAPAQHVARPPEQSQPVPPAVRIVVLGDNVGQLLARGLEAAYADTPQIAISRQTRDSSGLINNRFFDWADAAKKLLSSGEKVDIAVMMLGSNDAQELLDGKERQRVRSDPWVKTYRSRIEAIATQFRDKKIPLLWVGMPIMRGERLSAEMLAFNEIYRDTVQKSGGIYVDIWEAFVDDRNRFTLFGPDINGQIVKLRAGDGVHFTPSGSRKLAYFLESQLKRLIDERRPRTDPVIAALAPGAATAAVAPTPDPSAQPKSPEILHPEAPAPAGPRVAALPPAPPIPKPIAAPVRPAAGPVLRLTTAEISSDGELATSRRKAGGAQVQSAFVQRRLNDGAPIEAQPGRADDFSWPRP